METCSISEATRRYDDKIALFDLLYAEMHGGTGETGNGPSPEQRQQLPALDFKPFIDLIGERGREEDQESTPLYVPFLCTARGTIPSVMSTTLGWPETLTEFRARSMLT